MVNLYHIYSIMTMAFFLKRTAIILNKGLPFAGKSLIFMKSQLFSRLSELYYLNPVLL